MWPASSESSLGRMRFEAVEVAEQSPQLGTRLVTQGQLGELGGVEENMS